VLEKAGQLCAGATWHAAGLVTRFGGSPKIKKVHVRALDLMTSMHEAEEGGVGLHLTGSIRLIEKGDHDRLLEAKQNIAMAKLYDDPALPTTMLGPDEIAALHPLVDVSGIECGVFTPKDGDVDPTMLTTAISRYAKADGAQFRFNAEVQSVRKLGAAAGSADGGFEVVVRGEDGADEVLTADAVVNAAGLWSRRFSNQLGMAHPAFVIEHQYAITEAIPALAGRLGDGQRVPVLRDLAGSSYVRQERDGLLVGPYEEGVPVRTEWGEGPPRNFAFDLFPPALDRIEGCLAHAMGVIPALQEWASGPSSTARRSGRATRSRGAAARRCHGTTTSTRSRTASRSRSRSPSTSRTSSARASSRTTWRPSSTRCATARGRPTATRPPRCARRTPSTTPSRTRTRTARAAATRRRERRRPRGRRCWRRSGQREPSPPSPTRA